MSKKIISISILFSFLLIFTALPIMSAPIQIPSLKIGLTETESPAEITGVLKIIMLLTVLSVAPAIILMTTGFTRIVVVLSFLRQAIGTQNLPPNQVIIGLSLFLTYFVMSPMLDKVYNESYLPYSENKINYDAAITIAGAHSKDFMLAQTKEKDLDTFINFASIPAPKSVEEIPYKVVVPAFMISELKKAFQIGFLLYIPFLVIDMVVASILMSMGMMMVPPIVISLPFKIMLFVLIDGWSLLMESLVKGFVV